MSGNLLGESFKKYVNTQIDTRQKVHGKINRTLPELQYLNTKNAWIKFASGVSVEDKRLKLLRKNNPNNPMLKGVNKGFDLAIKNVLFNGLSSFGKLDEKLVEKNLGGKSKAFIASNQPKGNYYNFNQTQKAGIGESNGAYGVGGTSEYGYSPMPGIVDVDIKDLNRGSIKKATLNIKCHNKSQFDIIDVLYMRLGYSVLLEWGTDKYLDGLNSQGEGVVRQMGSTLIDKPFWKAFKSSYNNVLPSIEGLRSKYKGNYDGMFGVVSNFSWTFEPDGSYNIKLEMISHGDVIESLKANLPSIDPNSQSVDEYDKIVLDNLQETPANNQQEFFTLYPGFEDIINNWWADKDKWRWKVQSNSNLAFGSYYRMNVGNLNGFDFPSFKAGNYSNPDPINQEIIQSGKGADGQEAVVERAIRVSLNNIIKIAGERYLKQTKQMIDDGKEPLYFGVNYPSRTPYEEPVGGTTNDKDNGYPYLSGTFVLRNDRRFITALKEEFPQETDNIPSSIVNRQLKEEKYKIFQRKWLIAQAINGDDTQTLAQFKEGIFQYFKAVKLAGGSESKNVKGNDTDAEVEEISQEEQAQIDNEKELENNKDKNKVYNYFYRIKKVWEDKEDDFTFADGIYVDTSAGKLKIGSIINPTGTKEGTNRLVWNLQVGFPIYPKPYEYNGVDVIRMNFEPLNRQYFIRFGVLLSYIQNKIIPKIETSTKDQPMLLIDTDPKNNICYVIDNVISLDPNKVIIKNQQFSTDEKDEKIYKELDNFIIHGEGWSYGNLMNVYLNFARVEELFKDVDDKNQVSVFNILKNLSTDINDSLGNINNIEPVIDKETNTIKFIDQTPIPNLKSIALALDLPVYEESTTLEIFGYNNNNNTSNFVRSAGITTEISKDYATMITIGATANGAIPGNESTAFSKWNIGIKDRFKNNVIDGEAKRDQSIEKQNEVVIQKYKQFISRPFNKLGLSQGVGNQFIINNDFISLNRDRAQNYYIYAQAQISLLNEESIESSIGFIPFNLKLSMDGLSGIKIYNRVKVNSKFLPSNYGDTLDFIVTGVNHKLSDNEWVTNLDTIATIKNK